MDVICADAPSSPTGSCHSSRVTIREDTHLNPPHPRQPVKPAKRGETTSDLQARLPFRGRPVDARRAPPPSRVVWLPEGAPGLRKRSTKKDKKYGVNRRTVGEAPSCVFSQTNPHTVETGDDGVLVCLYNRSDDADSSYSASMPGGVFGSLGDLTSSVDVYPIFIGTAWLTNSPSPNDVMGALWRVCSESPYLSRLVQYGFTGDVTIKTPYVIHESSVPTTHSYDDIGDRLGHLIDAGVYDEPDDLDNTPFFVFFYPPGTRHEESLCGWHTSADTGTAFFDPDTALVAGVEYPDGGTTAQALSNILRAFTHELVETITDPFFAGWTMDREINGGDELGDACNNTMDSDNGDMVQAYWSEWHKACIIPKPMATFRVDAEETTLRSTIAASGDAELGGICFRGRTYHWDQYFDLKQLVLSASSNDFGPTAPYIWRFLDTTGAPVDISSGDSRTLYITTDTFWEDLSGPAGGVATFPIKVSASGNRLMIVNDNQANLFNFTVRIELHVYSFSNFWMYSVASERFQFEQAYYDDLRKCRALVFELANRYTKHVVPIGPGDPAPFVWEDKLSRWISGDRLSLLAQAAAVSAALQPSHPELAHELRSKAAEAGMVSLATLEPTRVKRRPRRASPPRQSRHAKPGES